MEFGQGVVLSCADVYVQKSLSKEELVAIYGLEALRRIDSLKEIDPLQRSIERCDYLLIVLKIRFLLWLKCKLNFVVAAISLQSILDELAGSHNLDLESQHPTAASPPLMAPMMTLEYCKSLSPSGNIT